MRSPRLFWIAPLFALALVGLPSIALSQATPAQPAPPPPGTYPYQPSLLRPFWEGTVCEGESVLFIRQSPESPAKARVLFPIQEILAVTNSYTDVTYEAGRDYLFTPGSREITLPPGSRIPASTPAELRRPANSQKYRLTHRDGNGEIFFGSALEYHARQTCITYRHEEGLWRGPVPRFDPAALPRSVFRLLNKQPLSIVVVGDSISAGCNASGWAGGAPFQPAYPELLQLHLQKRFGGPVSVVNPSVSGTDTAWVLNSMDKVLAPRPNLVVVAFGMNDAAGRPADQYQANIRKILERVRTELPDCEFLLVAPMLGNRDWTTLKPELFPQYREKLRELTGPGVALADLTSVWEQFLEHKLDWDQTGNGVNHPNDWGHRVYTQVLAAQLDPRGEIQPAGEPAAKVSAGPLQFEERRLLSNYTYSYACAVADLDGDGDLDITSADAEPNSNLYLLRNDRAAAGGREFALGYIQRHTGAAEQAVRMERHAIGDVNGDGRPDIVIVDNLKWDLRWFENPGPERLTQAWPRHRVCEAGGLPGAYDVDLADVDGDGDLDIAASSWRFGQRFDWYENIGRPGRGTEWIRHEIAGEAQETRAVVFADFNRDGRPDLLGTSRTGNRVLWFANPRDPVADRWAPQLIDSETIAPAHAHAVDLDRDGDLDVLLAAGIAAAVANDSPQSHRIAWYENLGQPGLGTEWRRHDIAAAFPQGFEAVAGDLDGDGDLDVAATGWSPQGCLVWFENAGDPRQPWSRHDLKTPWSNAVTLVIADVDGDQRPDILACAERGANELRLWRNLGPSAPRPANR